MKALVLVFLLATNAWADLPASVYRSAVGQRFFGMNQGRLGSCQAESFGAAIESAAAARGLYFRVSTHYLHAHIWRNLETSDDMTIRLEDEDASFLERLGPIVPQYMMPEDLEGLVVDNTGVRIKPSRIGIFDDRIASASGFSETSWTLTPGFRNSGSIQHIKELINANEAVSLSFQSEIIATFNHQTGMLTRPLSQFASTRDCRHSVAIVGYDDTLYADRPDLVSTPGAFIVRNSWNSETMSADTIRTDEDWQSGFRGRLSSRNMPGYYALPYEYIQYLTNNRITNSHYRLLSLNYGGFSAAYGQLQQHYHTRIVPFICDPLTGRRSTSEAFRGRVLRPLERALATLESAEYDSEAYRTASDTVSTILYQHTAYQGLDMGASRLYFAKLSSHDEHPEIDRVAQFYNGEFDSYYCGHQADRESHGRIWPTADIITSETLREAIEHLSIDPTSLVGWGMFLRGLL